MSKKDGGPAFPVNDDTWRVHGMTLRDYFAAKALPTIWECVTDNGRLAHGGEAESMLKMVSEQAYQVADAMLAERAK